MPRGVPTTLQGWVTRLKILPQYSHLSEEEITDLAKQRLALEPIAGLATPGLSRLVDLDDLSAVDPRFKKKFSKAWRTIYNDIEGLPPAIRERLAKQTAMAFMLSERKMAEEWRKGHIGDGANALNNLSQVLIRLVEEVQASPKSRPKERGKDDTVTGILSAAADKGRQIVDQNAQLEAEEQDLLDGSEDSPGSAGPENETDSP